MNRPRPWVIVPGISDSGPEHWQSLWQTEREREGAHGAPARVVRIEPSSWDEPEPSDWTAAISRAVATLDEPPLLVAHSLGVLAVAAWLREPVRPRVAGAFLVAPPDPRASTFPAAAAGFTEPSAATEPAAATEPSAATEPTAPAVPAVPTRLVVSDDDPYCTVDRALGFADALGADVLRVGALGHVNADSGIGSWAAGRALLEDFDRSL